MTNTHVFTSKAENYDRFRWGYADEAVSILLTRAQITSQSTVVDLGAGTGILTKHLVGAAGQVYAVEPNAEMRRVAMRVLGVSPSCVIVGERAEATGLPDSCADLVTVAQAIHWFDPESACAEIMRILKPSGWLAVLRNYGADERLNGAIGDVYTEENGCDPEIITNRPAWKPMAFYFGGDHFQQITFSYVEKMTRERFVGALLTASYAPDEDSPFYNRFAAAARKVFDHFSRDGVLDNLVRTELYLGQITR